MSETNVRYECHYCKKDFLQKAYLKHLLDNHLNELFIVSSGKKGSVNSNYRRLGNYVNGTLNIQDTPFTLDIPNSADVVYVCMKEVVAIHKRGSYMRKHCCATDKTHIDDNLKGLKALWERIQLLVNKDANVRIVEKVVEKVVEKIVYVDKPVEKIVYRDRGGGGEVNNETLTEMLYAINSQLIDKHKAERLVERLVVDITEAKRAVDVKNSLIKKLQVLCASGAAYDAKKMEEWIEDANRRFIGDESIVRKDIELYRKVISNIDTSADWEVHSEELKQLGVYDDVRDYIS